MKSNACEEYLVKLEQELPEMCRVKDLIKAKIFNSPTVATEARESGDSPPFFQMSKRGRVVYPRGGVIDWMRGKINARYTKEKGVPSQSIQQQ